jgi:hypothetical protein
MRREDKKGGKGTKLLLNTLLKVCERERGLGVEVRVRVRGGLEL